MQTILDKDNYYDYKYTGIDKWHNKGYYGSRVTIANFEPWNLKDFNPDGLCSDPLGIGTMTGSHALKVVNCIYQFAPLVKVVMLSCAENTAMDMDDLLQISLPYIEAHPEIILGTFSGGGYSRNDEEALSYLQRLSPQFTQFLPIGNSGGDSARDVTLQIDEVIGVGAYYVNASTGRAYVESYSSISDRIDYMAPTRINYPTGYSGSGTSFSTPVLCAMAAVVQDFFIDKTGRPMTGEKLRQFFTDCSYDLGEEGFDSKTGWGAVRLPDPDDVDIEKYRNKEEEEEVMVPTYKDDNLIDKDWAKEDVYAATELGLIKGDDTGYFRPLDNLSRQEAAVIIMRLYRLLKSEN